MSDETQVDREAVTEDIAERRADTEFTRRLADVRARAAQQAVSRVMAVLERMQVDGPDVDATISALDLRDALRHVDRPLPTAIERPTTEERRAVEAGAGQCPRCGWIEGTFECGIRHPGTTALLAAAPAPTEAGDVLCEHGRYWGSCPERCGEGE